MTHLESDALVIGAGPAGSAAAARLASTGLRVILVDRSRFPRDKVCGDALIPDALNALACLGVKDQVLAKANVLNGLRIYAPNGRFIGLSGTCACVPRVFLDDVLRNTAVTKGAQFRGSLKALSPLLEAGSVTGATFSQSSEAPEITVRARATILATGAASDALQRFGMCERSLPSATAARLYVRLPAQSPERLRELYISYDKSICPGYGWIFPGPDETYNVGVGYFYDAKRLPPERNLRKLFASFAERFEPARRLFQAGQIISSLKGAPLRTAFQGTTLSRPGLLVAGEAAGLTYSFSGEGIGKALESGMLAADAIATALNGNRGRLDAVAARKYEETLTNRFADRFRAYKRAQDWLAYPQVANFFQRRASAGTFVRRELERFLQETGDPWALFSPTGLLRALLG